MEHGLRATLGSSMWARHKNPWSCITRIVIGPCLAVALWFHAWFALAILILAAATNPWWFPPPKDPRNFFSRAVEGERLWLSEAPKAQVYGLLGAGVALTVPLVWALWTNRLVPTLIFAAIVVALKWCFLVWVAGLAKRREETA